MQTFGDNVVKLLTFTYSLFYQRKKHFYGPNNEIPYTGTLTVVFDNTICCALIKP